jgi:hypothetical protein
MKYLLIAALAVGLSGCGWVQRQQAHYAGHTKVCVEGVTYLQFPTGTTPQVTLDGKPVPCGSAAKVAK